MPRWVYIEFRKKYFARDHQRGRRYKRLSKDPAGLTATAAVMVFLGRPDHARLVPNTQKAAVCDRQATTWCSNGSKFVTSNSD